MGEIIDVIIRDPKKPERQVAATFDVGVENGLLEPKEMLERPSGAESRNGVAVIPTGPMHSAVNYKPRTLWGTSEGTPLTFLDSHMRMAGRRGSQMFVYDVPTLLDGECIEGWASMCCGIRFVFNLKTQHLLQSGSISREGLTWGSWSFGAYSGFFVEFEESRELRSVVRDVPLVVKALLQLWSNRDLRLPRVEVTFDRCNWRPIRGVCGEPLVEFDSEVVPSLFLPTVDVRLETIANWYSFSASLGPIPHIAVDRSPKLQSAVQLIASSLEGVHSRLNLENRSAGFKDVPDEKLRDARKAALKAGLGVLCDCMDEEVAKTSLRNSLSQLGSATFQERVEELVGPIDGIAPGLMGDDVSRWVASIKKIRNTQSHGGSTDDELNEEMVSRYTAILISGRWVLRLVLLRLVASDEYLSQHLKLSTGFMSSLANIDVEGHLGGGGLDRFLKSPN